MSLVFKITILSGWLKIMRFPFSREQKNSFIMGKGDKKTKRGKINRGTFGARRPRVKKKPSIEGKISIGNKAKVK